MWLLHPFPENILVKKLKGVINDDEQCSGKTLNFEAEIIEIKQGA
jgi:hypothetical protein